ncbi:MAG: glycosyltransferase family 39 protein [Deltaproteobacteria bacterium]|nr:glycosyltransferase family 39 protein [Deltaproteobacteria bacterium]
MANHFLERKYILTTGVFLLFMILQLRGLREPFLIGHQGFNGALRSTIGSNYLRYGFINTRLLPFKNYGTVKDGDLGRHGKVHWHHPPLINILTGVSFSIFGESESSARFFPLLSSIILFWLLFYYLNRHYGYSAAIFGCIFLSIFPMQIEYGKMPNYESLILALTMLAIVSLDFRDKYPLPSALVFIISLLMAGFTDWPGFIIAGLIGFFALFRKGNIKLFLITGILLSTLLMFLFWWLNRYSEKDGLMGLARYRAGMGSIKVSYYQLFSRTLDRLMNYYGLFAVIPGFLLITWRVVTRGKSDIVIAVFSLSTILYFSVFKAGAYIHIFFLQYITPAVAVAAGISFSILIKIPEVFVQNTDGSEIVSFYETKIKYVLFFSGVILFLPLFITDYSGLINKAYLLSRGIRNYSKSQKLPYGGRSDIKYIGSFIRRISQPDDFIAVHKKSNSSPQLRYYIRRNTVRTWKLPAMMQKKASFYLIPRRILSKEKQRRLSEKYKVYSILRYLVYDLRKGVRPKISGMELVQKPSHFFELWLQGGFSPVATITPSREATEEYRNWLK